MKDNLKLKITCMTSHAKKGHSWNYINQTKKKKLRTVDIFPTTLNPLPDNKF